MVHNLAITVKSIRRCGLCHEQLNHKPFHSAKKNEKFVLNCLYGTV